MSIDYIVYTESELLERERNAYNRATKEAQKKVEKAKSDAKKREKELVKSYQQQMNELMKKQASQEAQMKKLQEKEIEIGKKLGEANLNKSKIEKLEKELTQVKNEQIQLEKNLIAKEESTKKRASLYMQKCLDLIQQLESLDVQRFYPKELEDYIKQINIAKENVKNKDYEASLAVLQVRFQDLSRLVSETMKRNARFQILKREADQAISELEQSLAINKEREVIYKENDHDIVDRCDIDFWSYGKYSKTQEVAEELRKALEKLDPEAQEEDLEKIIQQAITQKEMIKVIVDDATRDFIRTGILEDSANQLNRTLIENGWNLKKMNREDDRDPAAIHYIDGNDNELTIICAKGQEDDEMEIVLDIHGDMDDKRRSQVKEGVIHSIFDEEKIKKLQVSKECSKTPEEFEKKIIDHYQKRKRG